MASYEMRISDCSSVVCSSDLAVECADQADHCFNPPLFGCACAGSADGCRFPPLAVQHRFRNRVRQRQRLFDPGDQRQDDEEVREIISGSKLADPHIGLFRRRAAAIAQDQDVDDEKRSEEHTSELQSLMRISYDAFCLKKNTTKHKQ